MRLVVLMTMGIDRPSGRRYFLIARELVRRGHRVRLLALHPELEQCPQRRFVQDGVEVWYVGQMHARKSDANPTRFGARELLGVLVRSTLGMIWGVACSPGDAYHLGKPQPINGVAALLAVLLGRGKRFYVDCDDDEVQSNRFTAGWQRRIFAFWQWLLPGLAAGATVNTRFLGERLARRGVTRLVHVPNGVDPARFQPAAPAVVAGLRAALGLEGRQVIAYVGTLALQNHPVDLLLEAFALLAGRFPAACLLLIGGGEDLGALRDQARRLGLEHRIYFSGPVLQRSLPAFLGLAALSVDPVYDDDVARARSPLKVFESMALGVPVVTGAVGDRPDVLDHGAAGVLTAPGDAAALAEGIAGLLGDETRRRELAQNARKRAALYEWAALASRWETIYEKEATNQ